MLENLLPLLPQLAILAMLTIVFLQSGIDKIVDWKGNLDFMSLHFAKSPFKSMVAMNMAVITCLELASGLSALLGVFALILGYSNEIALLAAVLSSLTFLCLLLGQRLAKDYVGAQTIVIYLIPTFMLLYMLVN